MTRQIQNILKCAASTFIQGFTLLFITMTLAQAAPWLTLAPGIKYQDLLINPLTPWAHIHAFSIDLKLFRLDLITAKDVGRQKATVHQLARKGKALIAINGGFFDKKYRPLGLRINQQQEHNPVKRVSWWGVFFIKDSAPYIVNSLEYQPQPGIQFAVQSGPRLLINGRIPHLKPGIAERSALGITRHNQLIILATENAMVTTTELAQLMKSSPFNCVNALNLDGGSSTQLNAHIHKFRLRVNGYSHLSDAIIVKNN
jgi:uncharacterized protein YigE (DUF2233 family)